MNKLTLSSPWLTFVHEIYALFGEDPEVRIAYDKETFEVKLFVENWRKADALSKLLPAEKTFGNITVTITVIPANDSDGSPFALVKEAFAGNPVFVGAETSSTTIGSFNYAVFQKKVVQFYNDQLDDINGNKSMLYQDIVKDVIGPQDGVFFCTHWKETED